MGEVGLINSKPKYRSKLRLGTPAILRLKRSENTKAAAP
jgi:hypothetical protein